MKKVLITGISGFVGHYLDELLSKQDFEIHGTVRKIDLNESFAKAILHEINLLDGNAVRDLLDQIKPDYIYHLAALTSPRESFQRPLETIHDNTSLQLNILEAMKALDMKDTRLLVTSSGETYGKVEEKDLPIDEETPLRPLSPYGVSKITQDYLALQYHLSFGIDLLRTRPFNHIGPGQGPHFVVPSFAKQIAEIEKGKQEPVLKVGNLEAKRDFADVRDVVRAYSMLVEKGTAGEVYNIGSGTSHKIKDVLNMLLSMSSVDVKVEQDPELMRPSDILETRCDNTKIKEAVGWIPEIPLEKSLEDTLNYWRERV